MGTKKNKDAVIQELEAEQVLLSSQIRKLKAREKEAKLKINWIKSPYRYGDILEIDKCISAGKFQVVVTEASFFSCSGRPIKKNGELSQNSRHVYESDNPVRVGRYTGSDLPPKPEEAAWAERFQGAED